VEFGVHGAYAYEIAGIALFSADAKTVITFTPWSITMTGQGKFIGIPVSNDTTRISATSFMTDGTVENQIWRGIVTLAFGMDADNEFTVYGRAELEVGLRKGSIGCIVFVCLPPFDFTVARRGYDAGKFLRAGNKVWGARTYAELFGLQVFIFARFAPGIDVEAGTNLSVYKPVLPALRSAEETAQVAHHADIDAPAVRVTIAEAITTTNRAAPLPLQATRPDGVQRHAAGCLRECGSQPAHLCPRPGQPGQRSGALDDPHPTGQRADGVGCRPARADHQLHRLHRRRSTGERRTTTRRSPERRIRFDFPDRLVGQQR
jgi:hypothetical protein